MFPLGKLIGATRIISTLGGNKGLDKLCSELVPPSSGHETEHKLRLVQKLGALRTDSHLDVFLKPEEEKAAQTIIGSVPDYIPIIILHPGSKDRFKQWPIEHFIKIGNKLHAHTGAIMLITGSKSEHPLTSMLASHTPNSVLIPGNTSIRIIGAIMKKAKLVIVNDTGPMHLAAALSVPVLAPFSPTDPSTCGPISPRAQVIYKPKTCSPCLRKKCRDPFCMRQIGVDELYEAAIRLI